jgi:hypothetical protein
MKLLGMLSVLIAAFSIGSLSYAQPQKDEENVAYEHLKVLEPIIGTWTTSFDNNYTGWHVEIMTTYSWSPTQKMLVAKGKTRRVKIGDDSSTQEWSDLDVPEFWMWNTVSKSIERYSVVPEAGMACVDKVVSKGEGVFEIAPIHGNHFLGNYTLKMVLKDKEIHNTFANLTGPKGEKQDDIELVSKRVAADGDK